MLYTFTKLTKQNVYIYIYIEREREREICVHQDKGTTPHFSQVTYEGAYSDGVERLADLLVRPAAGGRGLGLVLTAQGVAHLFGGRALHPLTLNKTGGAGLILLT